MPSHVYDLILNWNKTNMDKVKMMGIIHWNFVAIHFHIQASLIEMKLSQKLLYISTHTYTHKYRAFLPIDVSIDSVLISRLVKEKFKM